jgi:hypothetical protein
MSNKKSNSRTTAIFTAIITLVEVTVLSALNQQISLSSYSLIGQGIFQINGTLPIGDAVNVSVGQCAGFSSRYSSTCGGFVLRSGQNNYTVFLSCQLVTLSNHTVMFRRLSSPVADYQLFYAKSSCSMAVATGNLSLIR